MFYVCSVVCGYDYNGLVKTSTTMRDTPSQMSATGSTTHFIQRPRRHTRKSLISCPCCCCVCIHKRSAFHISLAMLERWVAALQCHVQPWHEYNLWLRWRTQSMLWPRGLGASVEKVGDGWYITILPLLSLHVTVNHRCEWNYPLLKRCWGYLSGGICDFIH
jgi:hypothetical protein